MLLLANFLKSLLKRGGLYLDLNFFFFFLIQDDPEVKMLVLLGEVGGVEEYLICEALKNGRINKPMVAWCIGTCSDMFTTDVQFGHAGASAGAEAETATAKNKALLQGNVTRYLKNQVTIW